ncbi:MAG: TPM domain-containing protein [Chthoniobacterales bacterium]
MARYFSFFLFFLLSLVALKGAEGLPPSPKNYFNDEAGIISPAVAAKLNAQLAAFDQQTSNQVVVVIEPKFSSNTSLDDYAQQLYSAWHLGTKKNSNGVLLLVFAKEHQIRIQTGYGLEGALPDALCKQIIDEVMAPLFQQGNPNQAMSAGVDAILKATAGEYKNNSPLKKKSPLSWQHLLFSPFGFFLLIMIVSFFLRRWSGSGSNGGGGWFIGGGGFGGGSGGGGDWGGFSGGGGESGGGGADGSW